MATSLFVKQIILADMKNNAKLLQYWPFVTEVHLSLVASSHRGLLTHLSLDKMAAILTDDIFKCIFLNENDRISIKISLKFVPRNPIKPALVQVMAWRRIGDNMENVSIWWCHKV